MKWITREGVKIDIKDMKDLHLENSIKYLQKKLKWWSENSINYYSPFMPPQGEMAELALEQEINHNENLADDIQNWVQILKKEKEKRNNLSYNENK